MGITRLCATFFSFLDLYKNDFMYFLLACLYNFLGKINLPPPNPTLNPKPVPLFP